MNLIISSMGDGKKENLTIGLIEKLKYAKRVVLQTEKVEAAEYLRSLEIVFETLDVLYEQSEDFDSLNRAISDMIFEGDDDTCFCILGAPYGHTAIPGILKEAAKRKVEVAFLPGLSYFDTALCAGIQKTPSNGLITLPASQIESFYAPQDLTVCITEIDTQMKASAVKEKLAAWYGDEQRIVFYDGNTAKTVYIYALDRQKAYSHLSSAVYYPQTLIKKLRFSFEDLIRVMDKLRAKEGCPWDREQTHTSLKQYLLEEAYEVLEAIDEEDEAKLYDELGDVLLQVVFHACIARQTGSFDILDVTTAICKKMIKRHPHIFGKVTAKTAKDVIRNWEAIKKEEKGHETYTDVLKDIPKHIPALMKSYKVQKKAANVGFDWESPLGAADKIREETDELMEAVRQSTDEHIASEAGDLLFSVVNLCRMLHVEPETALLKTTQKFIDRFEYIEQSALKDGVLLKDMTLSEMDKLWEEAKKNGL